MQHIPNISFIKTLDNPVQFAANSPDKSGDFKTSSQSFSNILQVQLSNTESNVAAAGIHERNETQNSANFSIEKNTKEKPEPHDLQNKAVNGEETVRKEKAGENSSGVNNKSEAKVKDKIESEPSREKEKARKSDEISFLLKTINYILEMLKGAGFDKKQGNEIKSTLLGLKNTLETKNNSADKKSAVSPADTDFKNLLDKLKKLLDTANERSSAKKINLKEFNFAIKPDAENPETADIKSLKKHVSNLIDEIKQHLNVRKQENTISKNGEPAESKNVNNQRIFSEVPVTEKKENLNAKDNGSAFNFSSYRKETEGVASANQKTNTGFAEKRSAFSDQLDVIMQNAKIAVRDSKNGSFSIRLYPESLGKVNVNLSLEQGVIFGKFLVDSTDAKEALLENIQSVIDRLQENGISVGSFNVNVRDEKKPLYESGGEIPLYIAAGNHAVSAGAEYESNSSYLHSGEIDVII
jgi:flagellar hook-length control protein FliK